MRFMTTRLFKTLPIAIAVVAAVFPVVHSARADMVVIRASGPGLKSGQVIPSGSPVSLPGGSSAVLLAQDGRNVSLKGPYQGVPDTSSGGDGKVVTALSRLLTTGGGDTASLGVTRGTDIFDPHAVNPAGGLYCATSRRPAVFQRGMSITTTKITITSAAGSVAVVKWPESQPEIAWPQDMPMRDGVTYQLLQDGKPNPTKLLIRRVPGDVEGDAETAAWMAENGCSRQALAILHSIH